MAYRCFILLFGFMFASGSNVETAPKGHVLSVLSELLSEAFIRCKQFVDEEQLQVRFTIIGVIFLFVHCCASCIEKDIKEELFFYRNVICPVRAKLKRCLFPRHPFKELKGIDQRFFRFDELEREEGFYLLPLDRYSVVRIPLKIVFTLCLEKMFYKGCDYYSVWLYRNYRF